jgi:hypothetical protein
MPITISGTMGLQEDAPIAYEVRAGLPETIHGGDLRLYCTQEHLLRLYHELQDFLFPPTDPGRVAHIIDDCWARKPA